MGMYCFGIDVGGTSVKCGLFLTNGTLVEQWEIPTRLENNGSSILPDVADAIKTKLDERGITKDNVDGVGIGIPGPVNENGEVPMAVNLHWGFKAVASELSDLAGIPAQRYISTAAVAKYVQYPSLLSVRKYFTKSSFSGTFPGNIL